MLWLRTIVDERNANPTEDVKYCYITQAKLKRKTVFIFRDCNSFVNNPVFVLDWEGNRVMNDDGDDVYAVNIGDELKNERIVWQPADFSCDLNGNTIG